MKKFSSIFGQILQIFDKRDFLQTARYTRFEHAAKGFTTSCPLLTTDIKIQRHHFKS